MSTASPDHIMRLAFGFWASKALLSAVELGVFSELAKGPADLQMLQRKLGLHPRSARDFLDALVALKLLDRSNSGFYSNSAESDVFLDRAKSSSYLGGVMEMANARLYGFWGSLTEALKTGLHQNEAKNGVDIFTEIYSDPGRLALFLASTSGISAGPASQIAAKFDWRSYNSFVDIGAAQGMLPVTLARAHPHLRGLGFDLPNVQPVFERFVKENDLTHRVRFHAGDFFKEELPQADVVVMGHILHDWDLPQKKLLLSKAFEALPDGGAIIVYDTIIDDDRRENAFGLLMSLNMLIETPGGFDYTGADCQSWMHEIGFKRTSLVHLAGPESMVVAEK